MTAQERAAKVAKTGRMIGSVILVLIGLFGVIWVTDTIRRLVEAQPKPGPYDRLVERYVPSIDVPATNTICHGEWLWIQNPLGPRQKLRFESIDNPDTLVIEMKRVFGKKEVTIPIFPAGDKRNLGIISGPYEKVGVRILSSVKENPNLDHLRYWYD